MIGSLRGVLLDRTTRAGPTCELVVEVGGVGYRVVTPSSTVARIGGPGEAVFLHVHTHVREDAIVLYGFAERDERGCFEVLIGSHGVGPSVALALLSVHSPAALRKAVQNDDIDALMLVPGIGRKTAARLLIELKSRLDLDEPDLTIVHSGGGAEGRSGEATRVEVRTALAGLGYGADEIRQALSQLPGEGTLEEHIRLALRYLASGR